MSDSQIMMGLLVFMILTASVIPFIQRDFGSENVDTYNINATSDDLSQIDPDKVLSASTSISILGSFFNMFFWVYSGLGIIFNTVLLIVKFMFWWLIIKLIRGT